MRFVPAFVLLVLAAAFALLSADFRSWGRTLRSDDALVAVAPAQAQFAAPVHIPFGIARSVLGIGDDIAYGRALAEYRVAAAIPVRLDNAAQVAAVHTLAENELAAVARTSGNPQRASQAETLVGVLSFADLAQPVGVGGIRPTGIGRSQADAALASFDTAVRENPDDVTAKYDLELLLRALLVQGTRIGPASQAGPSTGRHGAGGGQPGSGY